MDYLGKIFISHSSTDKPFVRNLAKKIKEADFQVWIDEHDLIVGDPLTTKIGNALSTAQIVLFIISTTSINSKWLKYELNIATERMVRGQCRVIPIIIDDAKLPNEIQGLLYANCRESLDSGWNSIFTALQYENHRSAREKGFWAQSEELITSVFGSKSWCSILGEYKSQDYETISIPVADEENNGEYNVIYETVSSYFDNAESLNETWLKEYCAVMNNFPELLHLVVTQRPISFTLDYRHPQCDRVGIRSLWIEELGIPLQHIVIADLHNLHNEQEWKTILICAKESLIKLAGEENNRRKNHSREN